MLVDVRNAPNYLDVAISLGEKLAESTVERDAKVAIPELEIERLRESGLLALVVPKEYGGLGATWVEAFKIVQELSKVDGSIGQLYANHLNLTVLAHVSGTSEQKERYYRETARNNWFWANAINTWDRSLKIIPQGENFRLNGVKSFDLVVAVADLRVFSAWQDGVEGSLFLVLPKDRDGIIVDNAGDTIRSSRSDRSSFTFQNVLVKQEEILATSNPSNSAFSTFLGVIAQLTKTYISLGIANGALEAVQENTETVSRHSNLSRVGKVRQNSDILGDCGDLWIELKTAIRLADRVADIVQVAWERELRLTHEERGEVANAIFSAETFSTRVAWDITNRIFALMGSGANSKNYNLDRYCRDLHTFGGIAMPWKGAPQNWNLTCFSPTNSVLKSPGVEISK
jgi:alkylation response protein AidB-like acyl-CoA dehydrogenase